MKLSQVILFSLAVVLLIIGVHQTMMHGIQNSYFIFMFTTAILLYYFYRKKQDQDESGKKPNAIKPQKRLRKKIK